ncbi:MAG TPA: hypothetical protein VMA09_08135 [Candidatus Binataceae bacterium]|nr:hypothetical protein [Candidatus Binataceae bacterium]
MSGEDGCVWNGAARDARIQSGVNRSTRDNHVVDNNRPFAANVADYVACHHLLIVDSNFRDDCYWKVERSTVLLRDAQSGHVRCDYNSIERLMNKRLEKQRYRAEMVDRDCEGAFDRGAVQIRGHDAADAGHSQKVCDQSGTNRSTAMLTPRLP